MAVCNMIQEVMNELRSFEKNKKISQDEHKRALNQFQKLTDAFIGDIEQIG